MYQIKNNIFCLKISKVGAELEKLCIHNINILWEKNELWNRQSPILFPIVGQIKDGFYLYENTSYNLSCHGFIRDEDFNVVQYDSDLIKLSSKYNENTLKMFPFKYEFNITYRLIENAIKIILEVKNLDSKEMYFSCGLHPGFSYAGLNQLFQQEVQVEFSHTNVKSVEFTPSFVAAVKEEMIERRLELSELSSKLQEYKTLCYQGLNSIELKSQTKAIIIKNKMPYTALWQANPKAPQFLCIEPWYGLPDELDTNHELKDKKYLQRLEQGKSFKTEVEISFIDEVK